MFSLDFPKSFWLNYPTKNKEAKPMTQKQIEQVNAQLPAGEKLDRMYSAFEGGIRVISKDAAGCETRYAAHFDADDNVTIERM